MRPNTMYRPSFEVTVDEVRGTITMGDPVTGGSVVFSTLTHKAIEQVPPSQLWAILPALNVERHFARLTGPASPAMAGDHHDTTKAAGTTGGGRRSFVSVPFERHLRGFADGIIDLRSWAMDQGQRPTAWFPMDFKYDGYFGTEATTGWKCDKQDADGWSIFRADHLESAPLAAGTALGDDICTAHFLMLLSWVSKTFYNAKVGKLQQGWHGSRQPRAMGWMLWFYARAVMLGFDTADDAFVSTFLGAKPKVILKALVADLVKRLPRLGENKADDRTMVDLKDGSGEIRADYPWQWAVLFAAIGWLVEADVLQSRDWYYLRDYIRTLSHEIADRSLKNGFASYAISASANFTQADVDRANELENDKSHVYELVNGVIRDTPTRANVDDTALFCGGFGMLHGYGVPAVLEMLAALPKPIETATYDDIARYVDPVYGMQESMVAPPGDNDPGVGW